MMRIVPEPVRAGRGELEAIARRLVEFAKSSPGCWVQTDELPANYANRIAMGTAREFQPDSEWRTSQTRKADFYPSAILDPERYIATFVSVA